MIQKEVIKEILLENRKEIVIPVWKWLLGI